MKGWPSIDLGAFVRMLPFLKTWGIKRKITSNHEQYRGHLKSDVFRLKRLTRLKRCIVSSFHIFYSLRLSNIVPSVAVNFFMVVSKWNQWIEEPQASTTYNVCFIFIFVFGFQVWPPPLLATKDRPAIPTTSPLLHSQKEEKTGSWNWPRWSLLFHFQGYISHVSNCVCVNYRRRNSIGLLTMTKICQPKHIQNKAILQNTLFIRLNPRFLQKAPVFTTEWSVSPCPLVYPLMLFVFVRRKSHWLVDCLVWTFSVDLVQLCFQQIFSKFNL